MFLSNEETAQRESFRDGYPADILGSFGRTSWVKNFGQALETLEKKHLSADIHDLNARMSMTLGGVGLFFSFPTFGASQVRLVEKPEWPWQAEIKMPQRGGVV